jgi:ubiquinone biosynthesis protein COQ4
MEMGFFRREGSDPVEAFRALLALNENHDDTTQVFRIIQALRSDSSERALERFRQTPVGARVLAERRCLIDALADRERLAALPEGSLGRAYLDFMVAQDITAEGLAGASMGIWNEAGSPDMVTFQSWSRDMHDLWHVAVGYGPDPLGELCLLAFTYAQYGSRGVGLIALAGALRYSLECRDLRIARAVWQGYRIGRDSEWLPAHDWEALLALPLEEVRRRLRLRPTTAYAEARRLMPKHHRADIAPVGPHAQPA